MNSHTPSHTVFLIAGVACFLLCLLFTHFRTTRWKAENGYAPPPSTTRTGNREYNARLRAALPPEIKTQLRIAQVAALVSLVTGIALAR
jgi:hypothetical protein